MAPFGMFARRAWLILVVVAAAISVPVALFLLRREEPPEAEIERSLPPKPRTVEQVLEVIAPRAEAGLRGSLQQAGFDGPPEKLTFVAVKSDRQLEVWGERDGANHLIKAYPFTAFSGSLGPKLREGDLQIPEGVYGFEYLNPNSSYHLSIKLDYPNAFDRRMAAREGRSEATLGGDIMIHGKAVTIGCIPVGDGAMEEIFYLVARVGLANSRIVIAPVDFRLKSRRPPGAMPSWLDELDREIEEALQPFAER